MNSIIFLLAIIFVLVGIVGTVIPAIPGTSFVFLGLLLVAWADNFAHVGWITLTILGLLTLGSFAIDFYTTTLGAKRVGASKLAIFGAAAGTLVGIFFGFVGLFIGPFIGAFAGEYIMRKDLKQSAKAGAGTWLGIALGMAAKVALVFTMIGIFVLAYIIG
jgi:uncharacterized protein YqgC (DUF456 family)